MHTIANTAKRPDPWHHAIATLEAAAASAGSDSEHELITRAPTRASSRKSAPHTLPRPSLTVRIVERLTHCTAAVSWHDATACCYDDQVWRAGVARRPGVCSLTGVPISRGDAIYRPVNSARPPVNDGAMILAVHFETADNE